MWETFTGHIILLFDQWNWWKLKPNSNCWVHWLSWRFCNNSVTIIKRLPNLSGNVTRIEVLNTYSLYYMYLYGDTRQDKRSCRSREKSCNKHTYILTWISFVCMMQTTPQGWKIQTSHLHIVITTLRSWRLVGM